MRGMHSRGGDNIACIGTLQTMSLFYGAGELESHVCGGR